MSSSASSGRVNRLAGETSPYLLQHAHNPVDWHPWGGEAIALARAENKPIFLSIGYSACHWCHVMERESFEDEEIAAVLNERFVSIKVDREERPDVDDLYMQAVQMMTGHGGWPMSVFLTPELKPFFAGTYFPPKDGPRGMGFKSLLVRLSGAHRADPNRINQSAGEIAAALAESASAPRVPGADATMTHDLLSRASHELTRRFDTAYGGFGPAPKFPPSMALDLLLREFARTKDDHLLAMAEKTLQCMARGGLQDQLGGGFHRYSTDHLWLAPHFEKMLYDNALLAPVYFNAAIVTGNAEYRRVGKRVLEYVIRDMQLPEGGYASAEDADSEGVEGKFYVWTPERVREVLESSEADLFCEFYDVTERGNFEGASIPRVITPLEEFAARHGEGVEAIERRLRAAEATLLEARGGRARPGRDDKVIAAWNGMMISAMARGAQATGEARFSDSAERAAEFIVERMRDGEGHLMRAWRAGTAKVRAFVEDYAHVAGGLVDLYETTFDPRWLREALALAERMTERFEDKEEGGFFTADGSDPHLIVRRKDLYDGATPSGNSAAAFALLRLAAHFDRDDLRESAMRAIAAAGAYLTRMPAAVHHHLCAVAYALAPAREIAVIGDAKDETTRAMLAVAWRRYPAPRAIASASGEIDGLPLLRGKKSIDGKPTAYVCENYACAAPATSAEELKAQLRDA